MLFAEVAVASTSSRQGQVFTYAVPDELSGVMAVGQLVRVPFGQRKLPGLILSLTPEAPSFATKDIEAIVEARPALTPPQIGLLLWIADHCRCSMGDALKLFLPPGQNQQAVLSASLRPEASVGPESLSQPERDILVLLARNGPLPVARIKRLVGVGGSEKILKGLEQKGCLTLTYLWQEAKIRPHYERFVALVETHSLDSDSDQQLPNGKGREAVLDYLRARAAPRKASSAGEEEWFPVAEVLRQTGASLLAVRALEKAGLVRTEQREVSRSSLTTKVFPLADPPTLTPSQGKVWEEIAGALVKGQHRIYLLHGVTGSGKTEIYMRAIARTIRLGKRAIVLVPEIALTPEMLSRFAARFPGRIALLHSQLTPGERFDEWRRIRAGEADIVIGSRSAIFCPVAELGLIVVDEEHEWSYKQENRPRYHARDVAIKLAELAEAPVVLGSATPDVVSFFRAKQGDFRLLELPQRVGQVTPDGRREVAPELALPPVQIVDLRQELKVGNRGVFSRALHHALAETIARNDQAILFLNRRGSASLVLCRSCGHVARCDRCTFSLVYHSAENELICHYCNKRSPLPLQCPQCQSPRIKQFGLGTQKVEEELAKAFPKARVLRWDRDVTGRRGAHDRLLRRFVDREADILVGTQMVAKGFDFPHVTLVGVVSADTSLHLPDFRAAERSFQMLTQVAGRAGRRRPGSQVIIQTFNPTHYSIQAAARHSYRLFYEQELEFRREQGYPPFSRLIRFVYSAKSERRCEETAEGFARVLRESIRVRRIQSVDVLGPAPCYLKRLRDHYRWQLVVRCQDPSDLLRDLMIPVGWTIDVDPVNML